VVGYAGGRASGRGEGVEGREGRKGGRGGEEREDGRRNRHVEERGGGEGTGWNIGCGDTTPYQGRGSSEGCWHYGTFPRCVPV